MPTKFWISTSSTSFNTAANWSDGVAPASGDVLVFNSLGTADCATNLSTGLSNLTIYVDASYTGNIGVVSSSARTPLEIQGGTVFVGRDLGGASTGSPLVYIRGTGTASLQANILQTSTSGLLNGLPPVILEGPNVTVNATGGLVGLGVLAGTSFTANLVNVAASTGRVPEVIIGEGASVSTVTATGSVVVSYSSNTLASLTASNGAEVTVFGSGNITNATVGATATLRHFGGGNITTLNVAGTFNRTGDTRAITISNLTIEGGASILLDNGRPGSTTRTTVVLSNCGMQNITVSTPIGERL